MMDLIMMGRYVNRCDECGVRDFVDYDGPRAAWSSGDVVDVDGWRCVDDETCDYRVRVMQSHWEMIARADGRWT